MSKDQGCPYCWETGSNWRDARKEEPPDATLMLVVHHNEVILTTYSKYAPYTVRWWMPLPEVPK